mgnify:CR=1 FL=1
MQSLAVGHIFFDDFWEDDLSYFSDLPFRFYPLSPFSLYFKDVSDTKKELDALEKLDETINRVGVEVTKVWSYTLPLIFIFSE